MVYETDYITKKTTFLPRLIGVELVVIGFELVGVGLLWRGKWPNVVGFGH